MNNEIQFILYHLPDEEGKVQVVIKDETIWATQKAMAQLFGVGVPSISKHLNHIFEEGELDKEVVVSKMEIATQHGAIEGKTQKNETAFYSLDAIIAVGYRVSSARATKFRQWATKILNEYIKKGFAIDEERLKQVSKSSLLPAQRPLLPTHLISSRSAKILPSLKSTQRSILLMQRRLTSPSKTMRRARKSLSAQWQGT